MFSFEVKQGPVVKSLHILCSSTDGERYYDMKGVRGGLNDYAVALNQEHVDTLKAVVDADPSAGDGRPQVKFDAPIDWQGDRAYALDYQQWRDIRGLTHSDP